jgi:hypothetical protein
MILEPITLQARRSLFDGMAPNDWTLPLAPLPEVPALSLNLAKIDSSNFADLEGQIGEVAFHQVLEAGGYKIPQGPFEAYIGQDRLQLRYLIHPEQGQQTQVLVIFACGEFQPSRIMLHLESIWRINPA